jgi:branched-subunit amino acid transport protein
MEVSWRVFVIIVLAAFVTWVPRILPLVLLSRIGLPNVLLRWLQQIPVAIMAALLAQELFIFNGKFELHGESLLAALASFAVAFWKRSLLLCVVAGMIAMMLLQFIG